MLTGIDVMLNAQIQAQVTMQDAPGSVIKAVRRRSVIGALLVSAAVVPARSAIMNLVAVGKDGWLFPVWDEVRRVDLKRLGGVVEVLNGAVDILKRANIQVVFAVTPVKSRVYREFLPDDFKFSADAEQRYSRGLEELRRSGALVADLLAPLVAFRTANPGGPVFFKGDTHWTGAGSQAAATELARLIQQKSHLQPATKPGTVVGPPTSVSWGKNDLAALLPPADAAKYPAETYLIRQPIEGAGSADLIDDEKADVVVVGNSFMQPRLGFTSMLSNRLNRPVSLSWKVHQFGPYQTLLGFLESDSFRRDKPGVIVWNLHESDMLMPADAKDGWGQNAMAPQAFLTKLRQVSGVG